MIDLISVGKKFIERHGKDKACEVTGKSIAFVNSWESGAKNPTVEDVQKMLEFDPDPIHAVHPLYTNPELGKRLAILMVTNRAVQPATMESVIRIYDPAKMQFIRQTTNFLTRGRNQAAWKFLQSGCEWSLWVDDDMVLPCGDAAWFKSVCSAPNFPDTFAGLNTIGRLIYHKKTLVGGCYFNRTPTGKAQFNEAALNRELDNAVHVSGPRNELRPTKWVATGCMLVHRSVYEAIAKQNPSIQLDSEHERYLGYRYGFFDPLEPGMGEDVSFCLRAEKAGHQPYVDLALMPSHIGQMAYNYFNTKSL